MNSDPTSLENLRDIVVPPAVSWWPLAPGWYVVIFTGLAVATFLAWRQLRQWKRNAYRREALDALRQAGSTSEIASLLKRTALSAFPRSEVAGLTGEAWCDWLETTGPSPMPSGIRSTLHRGTSDSDSGSTSELRSFAMSWMKFHRSEDSTQRKEADEPC